MLAKEGIVLFTVSSILASFISLGMFVVVSKEDGTDTQSEQTLSLTLSVNMANGLRALGRSLICSCAPSRPSCSKISEGRLEV